MSLKYVADGNLQTVTLANDYVAASGTMVLTAGHGARLPTAGDFWIANTSGTYRCFKVTARAVDTLTVTAAQDGTADGNLSAGSEMKWTMGLAALDQFRADLCGSGTLAGVPSAEKAGKLYLPTNSGYLVRDTGAALGYWGPVQKLTPPVLGDFTWVNQGTATADATYGGIYMVAPAAVGQNGRVLKKAAPATPYTITVMLKPLMAVAGYAKIGLIFRQSSNGYIHTWLYYNVGSYSKWASQKATDLSGGGASNYLDTAPYHLYPGELQWMRIADDGVNRILSYSLDGYHWLQYHSVGRTDFLTADEVGLYLDATQNLYDVAAWFLHWEQG